MIVRRLIDFNLTEKKAFQRYMVVLDKMGIFKFDEFKELYLEYYLAILDGDIIQT